MTREIDEQEFKKIVLEQFNEDADVSNAIDQWVLGGYSDKELMCLLGMAKHRAEKATEAYVESLNGVADKEYYEEHS